MWRFKKKYRGSKIGVKGFGLLNTNLESAETIYKLSLMPEHSILVKFIEKDEPKKESREVKRKSKESNE